MTPSHLFDALEMVPEKSAFPFHRQPLARNKGGYAGLLAEIFLVNRKTT
jgi:hypothetical protein